MGALAHFLEEEGLPTTHVSLIRLHTEKIKPPRALWAPFIFGRPFGAPNDPAFQTKIIMAALKLLEAPAGPVLEDFDEDAPSAGEAAQPWACPVSLPAPAETEKLGGALQAEIAQLAAWYNQTLKEHGRTTVGVSGLEPQQIGEFLAAFLEGDPPGNPRPDMGLPWVVKLATEDLKAFYLEAATAQPGMRFPNSGRLTDWFWEQTTAGRVYTQLSKQFGKSEDFETKLLGRVLMVPVNRAAAKK